MEILVAIIGGVFAILAALTPVILIRRKKAREKDMPSVTENIVLNKSKPYEVDEDSKYAISRISDIVKSEMRKRDFNVDGITFKPSFNINDLKTYTKKIYYPRQENDMLEEIIDNAREKAYTIKYSKPREDEKLTEIKSIQYNGLKHWEIYFNDLLDEIGINYFTKCQILDIGVGNGHSVKNLYSNIKNAIGIDISNGALEFARKALPNMRFYNNSAEDLRNIPNSSVDLVLSFRVFQSSLFDKRNALSEIYRVLCSGGYLILSIPIMFLKSKGVVLSGLIAPGEAKPTLSYADVVVNEIKVLMDVLNFTEIGVDKNSPFEYYIYCKRP